MNKPIIEIEGIESLIPETEGFVFSVISAIEFDTHIEFAFNNKDGQVGQINISDLPEVLRLVEEIKTYSNSAADSMKLATAAIVNFAQENSVALAHE